MKNLITTTGSRLAKMTQPAPRTDITKIRIFYILACQFSAFGDRGLQVTDFC